MNQEGNIRETRGIWKHPVLFLMLLSVLLFCIPAVSSAAVTKVDIPLIEPIERLEPYEDDNWSYELTNVNWEFPLNFRFFSLGIDELKDPDNCIYGEVRLCSTYDFDITVKKPNFTADDVEKLHDPDSDVVKNSLYRRKVMDTSSFMSLVGFIPYLSNVSDMSIQKNILAGANVPCRIKGQMTVYGRFMGSGATLAWKIYEGDKEVPEEENEYYSVFEITSVEPLDPDYDGMIYAYVGEDQSAVGGFGVIKLAIKDVGIKVGPILDCDIHMKGWDVISARKHFDEWDAKSMSSRTYVHSCTQNGKEGCISWLESAAWKMKYKCSVQLKAKAFGIKLINLHKTLGKDEKLNIYGPRGRHKSLTFDEETKEGSPCEHRYYPVPVNVWSDEAMRQPVAGAAVGTFRSVEPDDVIRPYVTGITGADGTTTLWLPSSSSKHVLTAASGTMWGYAMQPSDMETGVNEPVNIVLKEGVPERTAPYTVEFYYQKDGVYPDEPDRTETRAGLVGDVAFLTEEDLESGRERYELDSVKSAVHYGAVLEDGSLALKVYFRPWYQLVFSLNGGTFNGSTSPVVEKYYWGDTAYFRVVPVRTGFTFLTWLGAGTYLPGDSWTVTGDHIFSAVWESFDLHRFIYSYNLKCDDEELLEHVTFLLYGPDGEVEDWGTSSSIISDTETHETTYFTTNDPYYIIPEPEEGYTVTITNTGDRAGITDRCYHGGTITVQKAPPTPTPTPAATPTETATAAPTATAKPVPKTGDGARPLLWAALMLAGMLGLGAVKARK